MFNTKFFQTRSTRSLNFGFPKQISHLEGKVQVATDVDVATDILDAGHMKIRTLTKSFILKSKTKA